MPPGLPTLLLPVAVPGADWRVAMNFQAEILATMGLIIFGICLVS